MWWSSPTTMLEFFKTIMLGDGSDLVHRLPDLFHTPSIARVPEKSVDRILRLPQLLHLFVVSCTNARYYQTIWHGTFEETCADTSTCSGQEFFRGIGRESETPDTYYSPIAPE